MGKDVSIALTRSREFFNSYLDKSTWVFTGYIDGEAQVPILITHYQEIKITIYTKKLKTDKNDPFSLNPHLN